MRRGTFAMERTSYMMCTPGSWAVLLPLPLPEPLPVLAVNGLSPRWRSRRLGAPNWWPKESRMSSWGGRAAAAMSWGVRGVEGIGILIVLVSCTGENKLESRRKSAPTVVGVRATNKVADGGPELFGGELRAHGGLGPSLFRCSPYRFRCGSDSDPRLPDVVQMPISAHLSRHAPFL